MTNRKGIPKRVVDAMGQVLPQENAPITPNPDQSFGRYHYCPRKDDVKSARIFFVKIMVINEKSIIATGVMKMEIEFMYFAL